ncbi:MAG: hypothetical protein R2941_24585 [Desulfobacterales bacterium]
MLHAIKQEMLIQNNGVIEIHSPELKTGMYAEIVILLKHTGESEPNPLSRMIGKGKGAFEHPEDADNFIRKERDRWE